MALQPDARFQQVRKLTEVSRALTYVSSESEALALGVQAATGLLPAHKVVLLVREPGEGLAIRAFPPIERWAQRTLMQGVETLDEAAIGRLRDLLDTGTQSRFLAVPLVVASEVGGVLAANLPLSSPLGAEDEEWLLTAIADQVAVAIEKIRLNQTAAVAEKARREREEQFQTLYDSSLLGLVFRTSDGQLLDANDAFLQLAGYTREELRAHALRWERLMAAGPHPVAPQAGRPQVPFEAELLRKDGQRVEVLVGQTSLVEQERDLVFVLDISAQKQAESSLRLLSETSKALLGASLDYDALFKSVAWLAVPRFADWCAVESVSEEGEGQHQIAIEHLSAARASRALEWRRRYPPTPASHDSVGEVIRTGQSQLHQRLPDTFLSEYAHPSETPSELQAVGLRSAILVPMVVHRRVVGVITFVRAATRRAFGQDDLLLAEAIGRRAALAIENARLYRQAQEAVALRDDFLAVAAHELKTPLTVLKLQFEVLQHSAEKGGRIEGKVDRRVGIASRQVQRLQKLVDDLLDVSRIRARRMALEPTPFDLVELVWEVVAHFEIEAKSVKSPIEVDVPGAPVHGDWDRARLEQVLVNLLSNALKYGPGKPVRVSIDGDDTSVWFSVKDHGIGIAHEDLARIFNRFERAVPTSNYGGLGLGLFIAREIVRAHHGNIQVVSHPSRGSEFIVRLPRSVEAGVAAAPH